jgi:hypothetical protein
MSLVDWHFNVVDSRLSDVNSIQRENVVAGHAIDTGQGKYLVDTWLGTLFVLDLRQPGTGNCKFTIAFLIGDFVAPNCDLAGAEPQPIANLL